MLKKFLVLLKPPIFPHDEEKTHRARALNALYINMAATLIMLEGLGIAFVFKEKFISTIILIVGVLVVIMGMFLNRRGRVLFSTNLLLISLWILTIVMTSLSGGIRSLHILFFISGTVIAGITLGAGGALFYAGLSLFSGLALILIENAGFVFPLLFTFPPVSVWIILFINLVFTVLPLQITLQGLSDSARRARVNEERFRLIASVISDYAYHIRFGENGEVLSQWTHGAFEAITGYSTDEYFGRGGWLSILHPQDRGQDAKDMELLRANQKVITEVRIIRKNGEIKWVRSYGNPVWDDKAKKLIGLYGAVQDITEKKRMEENLSQRESILAAVAGSAEILLKTANWKDELNSILESLGKSIHASHAYFFENQMKEDRRIFTTMVSEWTAPGFTSELGDPRYTDIYIRENDLESWYNTMSRGLPYLGDKTRLNEEDYEYLFSRGMLAILDVPIFINSEWCGSLGFDDMAQGRAWTSAEVDALKVAGNVFGAAIKRKRDEGILQEELHKRKLLILELELRNAEAETLRESTAIVASTLEISEIVRRILEQIKRVVRYDSASVWLYEGEKEVMVGWNGLPLEMEKMGEYVRSADTPDYRFWKNDEEVPYILINDLQIDYPIYRKPPLNYIHSWLGVPLRARGILIGYIALDGNTAGRFTEHDANVARTFAEQVSVAFDNARLFSGLQTELEGRKKLIAALKVKNIESETLRESAAIVAATLKQSEAMELILEQLERVIYFDSASVQLLKGNFLEMVSARGFDMNLDGFNKQFEINENEPAYPVIIGQKPYLLFNDIQTEFPAFNEIPHDNIQTWMVVPLKVKGEIIGIITIDGKKTAQFTEADAKLAVTYANQVAIAVENSRLYHEVQVELKVREKLIEELESKNAELERFTYTVSHDLRSPLVTIRGYLGYIEKNAHQGNLNTFFKDIKRVNDATDRMERLLKDLLELSRIGRLINKSQEVSMADIVQEAAEIVHGQIEQKGIALHTHPNLPAIYGDRPRLVEVLQNLIDNAAKYIGERENPLIEIGMETATEHGSPIFFVRDNGMGIDPQYHDLIFGLFEKLDASSEGTGIGLALVKRIIELHGGRIWVESEIGKGSTFRFTVSGKK